MKSIKYSILSLFLTLLAFSCADVPLPFETYEEMAKGGFARLLDNDGGAFFFTDPDNSAFTFEVEYYSENNGGDIASHEWFVRHRNNVTGEISDPALLTSLSSSSFGKDAKSGLPTGSFTFTLNESMAALGLTIADLNGGDDMIFDGYIVMNNGSRFGPENTGGSVQGGAGFDGIFRFIKPLLCTSDLAGEYVAVAVGTSTDGCCPDETTVEWNVTLAVGENPGEYTISDWSARLYFTWYEIYGITSDFDLSATIIDACNIISGEFDEPFGTTVTVSGSVDNLTGVITYSWINGYDDTAVVTLTPQ